MRSVNRSSGIWTGILASLLCASVGACASKPDRLDMVESKPVDPGDPRTEPDDDSLTDTVKKSAGDVRNGFGDAVSAPLVDLNLRRKEIPEVLKRASVNTYDLGGLARCESIAAEVARLDDVLGPDFDEPPGPAESNTEKGGRMATDYTLGAVRGAATDIIPFRGVVRRLTGAEKHQKAFDKAVDAGHVRRAYLKGVGMHKNCAPPAAPSWFVPGATPLMAEPAAAANASKKN